MNNNRILGLTEQAMEIMNRYDKYFIVTVSRIKGKLSAGILRQALDIIQSRHPRLNSHIIGYLDTIRFETEGTQKIPLRVLENISDLQWQEVLENELNERLDSSKGLVRSLLVSIAGKDNRCYLVITVHHAIAMASSVMRLHSEILTYCQNIIDGKEIKGIERLPALPSVETLIPRSAKGVRGAINNFLFLSRTALKTIWHRPKSLGFHKSVNNNFQDRTQVIQKQLNPDFTQQLINTCRENKTTVQGALCAAMILAAAKLLNADEKNNLRFICHSTIDIRKIFNPVISDEQLLVACSYATGFFNVNIHASFWELAWNIKQQNDKSLQNYQEIFSKILTYKYMTNICIKNPQSVPDTVAVTNIGKINIVKYYGSLEIEEISFFPVQSIINNNLTVAATTFSDTLFLNFVYCDRTISQNKMEQFVSYILFILVQSCMNISINFSYAVTD